MYGKYRIKKIDELKLLHEILQPMHERDKDAEIEDIE